MDVFRHRPTAAKAIWQITRPDAKEAIVVLTALCKEKGALAQMWTVKISAEMGSGAKAAIPAIRELLNDKEDYIRRNAANALKEINRETKPLSYWAAQPRTQIRRLDGLPS